MVCLITRARSSSRPSQSGYLKILIGFGAVGFILLCILWAVLLRRIKFTADKDLYAFALYGGVFFLVMNLFEPFFYQVVRRIFNVAFYSCWIFPESGKEPGRQAPGLNTMLYPITAWRA
jgi:hypothetical protein